MATASRPVQVIVEIDRAAISQPCQNILSACFSQMRSLVLDGCLFADTVDHLKPGQAATTLNADVSWADEAGENSVRGDGRSTLNQDRGKKVRSTCILEISSAVQVGVKDRFRVQTPDGQFVIVSFKRRDGIDEATQTLVCVANQEIEAQKGRRDG